MKIGMKVNGVSGLLAQLRNVGEKVPVNARKVMHRGAENIVREAKLNAPHDTGELEEAIHIEKKYGYRGRLSITIAVGGVINGVDVDAYAALIHENYESMKPGPGTIAKRAANPGRYIGEKFLERARASQDEKIRAALIESNTQVIKEEGP